MRSIGKVVPALGAAVALAVAGCGEDEESGTTARKPAPKQPAASSDGQALKLAADANDQLAFDKKKLTAKAGKVTLEMANPSQLPHAVAVEGSGVDKHGKTVMNGGTSTVTATLKKGTYTFYCPVEGHEAGGMKGTLTVR